MHYHIQTAPIWDAYKTETDCPLCKIYADREKRVIGQYLNENVMDPDFRVRSNRVGFCKTHIKALYSGQNCFINTTAALSATRSKNLCRATLLR